MLNDSSTIVAISTAKGVGGIGVVRVSGKQALKIAKTYVTLTYPLEWQNLPLLKIEKMLP